MSHLRPKAESQIISAGKEPEFALLASSLSRIWLDGASSGKSIKAHKAISWLENVLYG